jgi:glycosyltransferase involved in cell wall biosynthesis
MRLAVYCDYLYRVTGGSVSAELPFSLFVEQLAAHFEKVIVLGREDPDEEAFPYRVRAAEFAALPFYRSGADLGAVLATVPEAIRRFWRVLDESDVVWVLGPNPPHALLFAVLGVLRRRRVVLGVRQNLPELIRHRRPGRPAVLWTAWVLEAAFRLLARMLPVVVVGPDLARRYRAARSLLSVYVSLLRPADLVRDEDVARDYDGQRLRMLSVGRLDPEKNPVLLADVLSRALEADPRWALVVCGEGSLQDELVARARELGVEKRLELRGYVPIDGGLWALYRDAHALIHVSHTEGVPQVILEAFAARLPVVGTDVGGVADLVRDRGLLIGPDDPRAAGAALNRLAHDAALRERLVAEAARAAADHTLDAEAARVAGFLSMNS